MDNTTNDIVARAEAILFAEGAPIAKKKLAALLEIQEEGLPTILTPLQQRLTGGITLVESQSEVGLVVAPQQAPYLQNILARELDRDIGDAGLEVLAIVLYRGPSTRSDIDYIRGVNTSSTIRTLLARGLLERVGSSKEGREYVYNLTAETLAHLGISEVSAAPDYATIRRELEEFESEAHGRDSAGNPNNSE